MPPESDPLSDLNPAQRQAVLIPSGPLLIVAGPGSGKTRVLTHRIIHLIRQGVPPQRILAVTFTNKAAREMRTRVERALGVDAAGLTLGTFHAVAARFLRVHGAAIGLDPQFVIFDDEDQLALMKRAVQDLGLDPRRFSPRALLSAVSSAKSELLTAEALAGRARQYWDEVVARAYERYQELLGENHALDFDDLLMQMVALLRQAEAVRQRLQERFLHVLIDEFQDTNPAQYVMARLLAEGHGNLTVVGDPDQSIYSWRAADIRNLLNFEHDYPDATVVFLEQNYRSTQAILQLAQRVISSNRQRKPIALWTENSSGLPATLIEAYDEVEEAEAVARELLALREQGFSLRDCAVMYRTNAQSRPVEEAMVRWGIPYQLVGGTRFYQRREVKDAIAYLRVLANPWDSAGLERVLNVPPRGLGQRTAAELRRYARQQGLTPLQVAMMAEEQEGLSVAGRARNALVAFGRLMAELAVEVEAHSPHDLLDLVLMRVGYRDYLQDHFPDADDRWENLSELHTVASGYASLPPREALTSFLEEVALMSDVDELRDEGEGVTLITLHAAKGLEYPVVFIVGLEEGLLPHSRTLDDPSQIEEERRLAYVGITRAKQRLYLLRALRRSYAGAPTGLGPSRFLRDIPRELLVLGGRGRPAPQTSSVVASEAKQSPTSMRRLPPPQELTPAPTLYAAGDRVQHRVFGEGVVVSCTPKDNDAEVVVAFVNLGVKRLLASLAGLERVPSRSG